MSLGSRVRERREAIGMSRKELADHMGITASAVANYENEISSPKAELLYPLMDALNCDANYLYQDEMDALGGSPMKLLYEEANHIKKYRLLDPYGKEAVDSILNIEHRRCTEKETTKLYIAARDGSRIETEVDADLAIPEESDDIPE